MPRILSAAQLLLWHPSIWSPLGGIRTHNRPIANRLLYPLSYQGAQTRESLAVVVKSSARDNYITVSVLNDMPDGVNTI